MFISENCQRISSVLLFQFSKIVKTWRWAAMKPDMRECEFLRSQVMIWNLLSFKFIHSLGSHRRLSGLFSGFVGEGAEPPSTLHSAGAWGRPEWSPAPDGTLPTPCSSPGPAASTAPPLTAAGQCPACATTRWSPGRKQDGESTWRHCRSTLDKWGT